MAEQVVHPTHYNQVPGIECMDVVKHFDFCRGNAIKYLWRAGAKGDVVTDLKKAIYCIEQEIRDIEAVRAEESKSVDITTGDGTVIATKIFLDKGRPEFWLDSNGLSPDLQAALLQHDGLEAVVCKACGAVKAKDAECPLGCTEG